MQYMLLIYNDERLWAGLSDAERGSITQEYFTFTQGLRDSGAYVDGAPLQPTSTATTVRLRDGDQLVTDGPFAETKEQLGGYYLIDVETLDEALEWAARIPSARSGSVEVRPVMPVPVAAGEIG